MTLELEPTTENHELEPDELVMSTFEHGVICGNIIGELRTFLKEKNLGRVVDSSAEYRFLKKNPLKKGRKPGRQPDVSFVTQARLPGRLRSYPDIVPDLAVEVISPGDDDYDVEAKIIEYQNHGVRLIWVIHPVSRRVDVYRLASGMRPQAYMSGDELDGESVVPGFLLPVNLIFDYPVDTNPEPDSPGEANAD